MGTRNLTAVYSDGELRVAQYGQWDGYPDGQGATVLEFCKDASKLAALKIVLNRTRFVTDEEREETAKRLGMPEDGWMNQEQAEQWHHAYPYNNRDHGAEILNLMVNSAPESEILLKNDIDFVNDSLFCEWAYVIDLDAGQLECYAGFVTEPHEGQRFSGDPTQRPTGSYYPVRLLKKYPLDNLPDRAIFCAQLTWLEDHSGEELPDLVNDGQS